MSQPSSTLRATESAAYLSLAQHQHPGPSIQQSRTYASRPVSDANPMLRSRDETVLDIEDAEVDLRKEYSSRCMYTRKGRAKRPRLPQTFFEILPVDVCSRIAAYLSCGRPTQDALHLGETSPHLRNAVVSTLSYKYVCVSSWYYSQDVVKRWAVLFGADLHDLTILQPRCSDRDAYELMLNASSLRTVKLQDTTYAMHQHLISKEIKTLTLMLTGVTPRRLFSPTPSPSVHDLTLACVSSKRSASARWCCPLDMIFELCGARLIESAFPNLRAVEVRSGCNCDKNILWELVRCMPKLEKIRIEDVFIPVNILPRVKNLKSVQIRNLNTGLLLAHTIGAPLTHLSTREVVRTVDLESEEIWSGLTSLTIALGTGAESAFLATVPLFSETLQTLRLSRSTDDQRRIERKRDEGLSCGKPRKGIWLEMVKALPHVRKLGFKNIRIDLVEELEIVKHVGERLQTLDFALDTQQEYSLTRLECVMLAASVHCPSLRNLNVETGESNGPGLTTELLFPRRAIWMAQMGRKLGRALELLKRRSPFFDDEPLQLFARKLINR